MVFSIFKIEMADKNRLTIRKLVSDTSTKRPPTARISRHCAWKVIYDIVSCYEALTLQRGVGRDDWNKYTSLTTFLSRQCTNHKSKVVYSKTLYNFDSIQCLTVAFSCHLIPITVFAIKPVSLVSGHNTFVDTKHVIHCRLLEKTQSYNEKEWRVTIYIFFSIFTLSLL